MIVSGLNENHMHQGDKYKILFVKNTP